MNICGDDSSKNPTSNGGKSLKNVGSIGKQSAANMSVFSESSTSSCSSLIDSCQTEEEEKRRTEVGEERFRHSSSSFSSESVVSCVSGLASAGVATKFVIASGPRSRIAALSYTFAASSAVSNVPSQTRTRLDGSRISAAHLPHGRCRTPRNFFPAGDDGIFRPFLLAVALLLLQEPPNPLQSSSSLEQDDVSMQISLTYRFTRCRGRWKTSSSSPLEESVAPASVTEIRTSLGPPLECLWRKRTDGSESESRAESRV